MDLRRKILAAVTEVSISPWTCEWTFLLRDRLTEWPALWLNLESQTVRELSYLVILDQFLYSLLRTADMGPSAPAVDDSRSCVTTQKATWTI